MNSVWFLLSNRPLFQHVGGAHVPLVLPRTKVPQTRGLEVDPGDLGLALADLNLVDHVGRESAEVLGVADRVVRHAGLGHAELLEEIGLLARGQVGEVLLAEGEGVAEALENEVKYEAKYVARLSDIYTFLPVTSSTHFTTINSLIAMFWKGTI